MTLELAVTTRAAVAATAHGCGSENSIIVPSGMSLKIKTSPRGYDVFDEETPVGKTRNYSITVSYAEIDA